MPLVIGDEVRFCGATGTVVAVTATTDGDGRGSITYEDATFRFRVLKAPAKGSTQFPYVATNDPYFRVGLVRSEEDHTLFCLVFDDLPAPLGWGRWVQGVSTPSRWGEASEFAGQDAVVMTVGWRPGTITIKKGGVVKNAVHADLVLEYTTSDGDHEAWWQPAYPYNDLQLDEFGVPLRGPNRLGRFKTDTSGVLWAMRPDGTLEQIIFPRGIAALGNREQDRWTDGPVPECYLTSARVYYEQEWALVEEGANTTLDVAAVSITVKGPANGKAVLWLYDGAYRTPTGGLNLGAGGQATQTGLPPGTYACACYHPNDPAYGVPRQSLDATTAGGSYTVDFGGSWTEVSGGDCAGVLYFYGATPAPGVTIYSTTSGPEVPPHLVVWTAWQTTDANGAFGGSTPVGATTFVAEHAIYGAIKWDGVGWRDASMAARMTCIYSKNPPGASGSRGEGYLPWGFAGPHTNLPAGRRVGYWQNTVTDEKYYIHETPSGHGSYSDPMPRWKTGANFSDPAAAYTYHLYDVDGTDLGLTKLLVGDVLPPWAEPTNAFRQSTQGNTVMGILGGKYEGSVVEADRGREITADSLHEAARVGLEFGKWTQPLEHRSFSQTVADDADDHDASVSWPLTFGDWECAYCGAPTWGLPDGAYTRGHCMQCADYGVVSDERTYLLTRTLAALDDWLDTVIRTTSAGGRTGRLILGWPRPEEYDETDDYLVDDWAGYGVPRWVAVHIVLGTWFNGTFVDGESITDAEARLGRVVGPVQLKLMLTADYQGRGQTLRVACTRPDGQSEWRMVTIPVGASRGDPFPLNWYPHHAYPQGYTIDVTAMEKLVGDGAVYGVVVNDGPAWHSTVGVAVRHHLHSPYACDVALSQRDPFLVEDFAGRLHLVYLRDGRVMHRTLEGTCATWSAPSDITAKANWPHPCREPSLSPLPHGELVTSAHTQGSTRLWRSSDDGKHWE